jgi:hypothetical protein
MRKANGEVMALVLIGMFVAFGMIGECYGARPNKKAAQRGGCGL